MTVGSYYAILVWISSILLVPFHVVTGFIPSCSPPPPSSLPSATRRRVSLSLGLQILTTTPPPPPPLPTTVLDVEHVSWLLLLPGMASNHHLPWPLLDWSETSNHYHNNNIININNIVPWQDHVAFPLAALFLYVQLARPPARLVTPQQLDEICAGTNLQQQQQPSGSFRRRDNRSTKTTKNNNNNIQCLYKASRDGWSALDFHQCVDNCGSAVVVARSLGTGRIFGGYNPAGWRSTDDYITSTAAFLWCRNRQGILVKFPVLPGGNAAVFDFANAGPTFGASDLVLGPSQSAVMGGFAGPDAQDTSTSAGDLRRAKSVPGITYDTTSEWPVRGSLVLSEVEVYGRP